MNPMQWLNYHHLLYFWTVARLGSITEASRELNLAQPTVSGQIRTLEESLGEKLFSRTGRSLVLTDVGRVVFRYADEIFSLGRELVQTLEGRPTGKPMRLRVGISDSLPKLMTHRILSPALSLPEPVLLVCREGKTEHLLGDLAIHALDLVLCDEPMRRSVRVRAFNHLLGESGITFFATPELARRHRAGFPKSLDQAPVLLPTESAVQRRLLEEWFVAEQIRPRLSAEFEDSALLKVFGEHGAGIFPGATAVADEICDTYGVEVVGRVEGVVEQIYAISIERRITNPAVAAISAAARDTLFA